MTLNSATKIRDFVNTANNAVYVKRLGGGRHAIKGTLFAVWGICRDGNFVALPLTTNNWVIVRPGLVKNPGLYFTAQQLQDGVTSSLETR